MPFIAPSLKIKRYENETKDVISQKSKSKKSEPPKERRKKRIKSYKKPSRFQWQGIFQPFGV